MVPEYQTGIDGNVICLCHVDVCLALRGVKAFEGTNPVAMKNYSCYDLQYDPEKCIGCGACVERCPELDREALELLAKRARIEEHMRYLIKLNLNPRVCEIVSSCDLFVLDALSKEMEFNCTYHDSATWWSCAPLVTAGAIVVMDDDGNGVNMVFGPLATGADVQKFELPTQGAIHFCVPERRYLTGFTCAPAEGCPVRETYAHLFAFANDADVSLDTTRVLHRLLRCREHEGVLMRYDLVYMPIVD